MLLCHDEVDFAMVSCVVQVANSGKSMIRVLSDNTGGFSCRSIGCVGRAALQGTEGLARRNGTMLDINATCADLAPRCLQLVGMHAGAIRPHIHMPKAKSTNSLSCSLMCLGMFAP